MITECYKCDIYIHQWMRSADRWEIYTHTQSNANNSVSKEERLTLGWHNKVGEMWRTICFQISEDERRSLTENGEMTEGGRGKRYKSCVQGMGNGAKTVRKPQQEHRHPRIRHPRYQANSFLFQSSKCHQYVMTPTYFPQT